MKIKCIGYGSYRDGAKHFIPGHSYKYEKESWDQAKKALFSLQTNSEMY